MDEDQENLRYSNNVSSAIMMKVPTMCLGTLRQCFELQPDGLTLVQFLNAFVQNMDLENDEVLLKTVPDLVDLFCLVDVNGDQHMEWSEFVMFVIEQVVQDRDFKIFERFEDVNHHAIQPTASRQSVKVAKIIPDLNRLLVGVGAEIQIFNTEASSPTWLTNPDKLFLQHKGIKKSNESGLPATDASGSNQEHAATSTGGSGVLTGARGNDTVIDVLDIAYYGTHDILFVLRSDLCVEFYRFSSRTSFISETMEHCGFWRLDEPHYKIQIRDIPDETARMFIIGNSPEIATWLVTVSGSGRIVELSDHKVLSMHTDYVRDILVIATDQYSLLASCGMDKKVILWDLVTMQYRGTRVGHSAGVQCLAFDGKSVLFAGGFDYSVIGWDLDAQINKPIFNLWGHENTVHKVLAVGACDRCVSVDIDGVICLWDTSRANPNDKEERQIASTHCLEDHIRSMELFKDVGSRFKTANGLVLVGQGRRQHVYRIADFTETVSPPTNVLFSATLLMVISIHSKHILFWSAVTGAEQKKMSNFLPPGAEITSAILDDRLRKLIVGDSNGVIHVYNGLTSVKLKTFPAMPYAARFMIYTADKTIIVVAGAGDLLIFDELPSEESGAQLKLREARAHEADVVSMAYSHKHGLIATVDCTGCLILWNYEFLTCEGILHNFVDGEVNQIAFLDPFPLLAVADSTGILTLIPVGVAARIYRRQMWKVQLSVSSREDGDSLMSDLTLDEPEAEISLTAAEGTASEEKAAAVEGAGGEGSIAPKLSLDAVGAKPATPRSQVHTSRSGAESGVKSKSTTARSAASPRSDPRSSGRQKSDVKDVNKEEEEEDEEDEEEEEEEDDDDLDTIKVRKPKTFGLRRMKEYLTGRRDTKSMAVCLKSRNLDLKEKSEDIVKATLEKILKEREVARMQAENPYYSAAMFSLCDSSAHSTQDYINMYEGAEMEPFPKGVRIFVLCGHDDGTVSISNLTDVVKSLQIGLLPKDLEVPNRKGYNPRRVVVHRQIRYLEAQTHTWSKQEIDDGTQYVSATLSRVWQAHVAPVTTLKLVGEDDDVLTGSDDSSIQLWTLQGQSKGVLTRGREFDKLFRPRWRTPMNMRLREAKRAADAEVLVRELGLQRVDISHLIGAGTATSPQHQAKQSSAQAFSFDATKTWSPKAAGKSVTLVSPKYTLSPSKNDSFNSDSNEYVDDFESEPDHLRVVGQLHNRVTYKLSKKDFAKKELMEKFHKAMKDIQQIGRDSASGKKKKKRRRRRSERSDEGIFDQTNKTKSNIAGSTVDANNPFSDPAYMNEIMSEVTVDRKGLSSSEFFTSARAPHHNTTGNNGNPAKRQPGELSKSRELKEKSKYDHELAEIDAKDVNNWEIYSVNRQRALYSNLYQQLDNLGKSGRNIMLILETKLNTLSPGGNFRQFVRTLRKDRLVAKNELLRPHLEIVEKELEEKEEQRSLSSESSGGRSATSPAASQKSPPRPPVLAEEAKDDGEEERQPRRAILFKAKTEGYIKSTTLGTEERHNQTMSTWDTTERISGTETLVRADTNDSGFTEDGRGQEEVWTWSDRDASFNQGCFGQIVGSVRRSTLVAQQRKQSMLEASVDVAEGAIVTVLPPSAATSPPSSARIMSKVVSATTFSSDLKVLRQPTMYKAPPSKVPSTLPNHPANPLPLELQEQQSSKPRVRFPTFIEEPQQAKARPPKTMTLSASMPTLSTSNPKKASFLPRITVNTSLDSIAEGRPAAVAGGAKKTIAESEASRSTKFVGNSNMSLTRLTKLLEEESAAAPTPQQSGRPVDTDRTLPVRPSFHVEAMQRFDEKLHEIEKFSKLAQRLTRAEKRKGKANIGQQLFSRQVSQSSMGSAAAAATATAVPFSRMASQATFNSGLAWTGAVGPNQSTKLKSGRLTTSSAMLAKQTTMSGVLHITKHQKAAENNWVRKVAMAMGKDFLVEETEAQRRQRKVRERMAAVDDFSLDAEARIRRSRTMTDEKMLATRTFGPYPAVELVRFLRAFDSLATIFEISGSSSENISQVDARNTVSAAVAVPPPQVATTEEATVSKLLPAETATECVTTTTTSGSLFGRLTSTTEEQPTFSRQRSEEVENWAELDEILNQPLFPRQPPFISSKLLSGKYSKDPSKRASPGGFSGKGVQAAEENVSPIVRLMKTLSVQTMAASTAAAAAASQAGETVARTPRRTKSRRSPGKSPSPFGRSLSVDRSSPAAVPTLEDPKYLSPVKEVLPRISEERRISMKDSSFNNNEEELTKQPSASEKSPQKPSPSAKAFGIGGAGVSGGGGGGGGGGGSSNVSVQSTGESSAGGSVYGKPILIKVRLERLIHHKYFSSVVPEFREGLERLLSKKVVSGTPADQVMVNLPEVLVDMCPHMSPHERVKCLRYLTLKSTKLRQAVEEQQKMIDKEQVDEEVNRLSNLEAIFSFFDQDKEGMVWIQDVVEVLRKTLSNRAAEDRAMVQHHEHVNIYDVRSAERSMEVDPLEFRIEEIQEMQNRPINLGEFVQIFQDIFV